MLLIMTQPICVLHQKANKEMANHQASLVINSFLLMAVRIFSVHINFTSDSAGSWIRKKTKQNKNLVAFYLVLLDLTEKVNDHSETNVVIHDLLSISLFV